MVERERVLEVLRETLPPDVPAAALEKAASRLAALGEEWEELTFSPDDVGMTYSAQCKDICVIGELLTKGVPVRIFRKPGSAAAHSGPAKWWETGRRSPAAPAPR